MSRNAGDDLPEVVPNQGLTLESIPNSSPQVLSNHEAAGRAWHGTENDKYPALYDNTPKVVDDGEYAPHRTWSATDPSTSPEVAPAQPVPWEKLPAGDGAAANEPSDEASKEKTIFGIKRRIFIIIVIVIVVVVIAAAVGGGVGGTRARSSQGTPSAIESGTSSSQPVPSSTSSTTSSSSSTSTSTSSSTIPTPTIPAQRFLNNGTAPEGLAFQGFSEQTYLGNATTIVQEEGFHDFPFPIKSYVWLPDGTNCCVTFCQNKTTSSGWWCDPRYRPTFDGSFPRLSIWCGGNDGKKNVTCS
ncbi:hypothetical protein OQA88_2475 [Cercophora sp. LCS_1]